MLNLQFLTPLILFIILVTLIGLSTILFQPNTDKKMQVVSFNARISTTQEQQISTARDFCAINFALFGFIIIGSRNPSTVFTYHNPIRLLFTRKGILTPGLL